MNKKQKQQPAPSIEELWPGQSKEWYARAEENIDQYLALVIRIYDRMKAEGKDVSRMIAEDSE